MYRPDFSVFDHLDKDGNPVFRAVGGFELSQYTVVLLQKNNPDRITLGMKAECNMSLDELIFLALQNMHFFLGFKEKVTSKANFPPDKAKSIYGFEIDIIFENVNCPVYAVDTFNDVKFRYEGKAQIPFSY